MKTTGWFNVWQGAAGLDVGAVVLFSSVAGRFGNQGQTDYSAANDLLCKVASHMRRTRPDTRAIALDWTAWGGIGMATRGSIPKIMEMAGVQMLPPEAGVAWIRRELVSSDFSGEVIVAGDLGAMAAEADAHGGVDSARLAGEVGPMVGQVRASTNDGLVVTVTLDPPSQGFLQDHRIDGTPVLPGVMGMEAFAEAAAVIAPAGYAVRGIEGVTFAAPFKFYRDEPREVTVYAVVTPDPAGGEDLVAHCRLTGSRALPGSERPTVTTHFTGRVRLSRDAPAAERAEVADAAEPALSAAQVYTFYFHGPAYQVIEGAWRDGEGSAARLTDPLPPNHSPEDVPVLSAPRLVELCFQTAGLLQAGRDGVLALPLGVDRVRVLADPAGAQGPLLAKAEASGEAFDVVVVDADGGVVVKLEGYATIPFPAAIPGDIAETLRATYQH